MDGRRQRLSVQGRMKMALFLKKLSVFDGLLLAWVCVSVSVSE